MSNSDDLQKVEARKAKASKQRFGIYGAEEYSCRAHAEEERSSIGQLFIAQYRDTTPGCF
jgi:hypothetical protein